MRRVWLVALVGMMAACSEGGVPPRPQQDADAKMSAPDARGAVDAGPGGIIDAPLGGTVDAPLGGTVDAPLGGTVDARPTADAAPGSDSMFPPSTANIGWIGGACSNASTCMVPDPICLQEGFPNGMCTTECNGVCPDRTQPRDVGTFCIDGRPFGFDRGICASECDTSVLPPTGCAAGYSCLPKNRYLDAERVVDVCVPTPARGACDAQDQLVDIDYPDDGKLWIPREAQCGGSFPLVVQLHGINPSGNHTPSLGGGRHIEYLVRSLIDYGVIKPVLLAEPVQIDSGGSSTTLYAPQFWEPAAHLDLIKPQLMQRGITLSSLSYAGHSGAGCDPGNGLYLVLKRYAQLIPTYAPVMKLWGLEDVCYGPAYHYEAPIAALGGKSVVILNMWTGQSGPDAQTSFENGLIPDPANLLPCPDSLYGKCINHKVEPWCSYRTAAAAMVQHDDNPFFFYREALPQVFPVDPAVQPCR